MADSSPAQYPAWQQWLEDLLLSTGRVGAQINPGGGAPSRQPANTPVPGSVQPFNPQTVQGQPLPDWLQQGWRQTLNQYGVWAVIILVGLIGVWGLVSPGGGVAIIDRARR